MNNKEGRLHFSITANNEDIRRKLAETRQGIINSGKAAEEQGSKIEGMFKRAALAAGAFFTVQQATSFAKQIAVVRGEFQQLEVAFTTMLGSASKGKLMMQEAVEIAAKTPFDLKGVAQGAKQLLAYGSASQDVGKELVMLGNIAAGLSIPLNDMVYLYGTTQTQGRLFTQDLRQFMGRGIPLADELAKQFGVTKEQVGELVTAGKVGFPEVQKALQAMTADGGKFNNLMAEQSKTITGQISNLGDSIDVMFNKIGQSNEGVISGAIGGATSLIENYEAVGREIGALVVAYGAYRAAIITVSATQGVVANVRYATEIAELAKLLPVKKASADADIHAAVASGRLTLSKSEELIAMRAEVTAKLESLRLTAQQAVAEKALATTTHKATLEKALASKTMVAQREMELSLAKLSGSATQVELAQKSLIEAQEQRHIAVKARKATADTLAIANSRVISATTAVETMQNELNTVSQRTNTASTGFLTVAKTKLTAITAKLNAVVMANPYTIVAVAIAVLVYGIYKLCTAQTAAEKAQEAFNEKIEEGKKKQDEFVSKTNELIGAIRTETNTRYMQTKAFKELNDKYPDLLKNMSMEKLLLMDNLELQRLLAQYIEDKGKKDLFAGLDDARKKVKEAKKDLDDYVTGSSKTKGGTSIFEVVRLKNKIEEAEEYLKQWQNKLKKHRQIEADSRPVDVKIADLSKNITLLETQLSKIQRLQEDAKKNNPFRWNLYEFQEGAINAQISAKNKELKVLKEGNATQKEQNKNKTYWETQKQTAQDALEALGEAEKGGKKWNAAVNKINQASHKLKQWDISNRGDAKDATTIKKLAQEITALQLKLEDEKTAILEDGRKKRLALSEQELVEKKAVLKKEYDENVAQYKKLRKALPKEVTTTYNQRIEVANTAQIARNIRISKEAYNELQEHQKSITDVFLSEESKRLIAIKERYDKEREWADAQFKGGNMTTEQRDNYKSDVDKSQQHEELESLLKEYQTYADKRKEIEDKFNSEIATLQSKNTDGRYDKQIKQAKKQKNEALSKIDFDAFSKNIDFAGALGNIDKLSIDYIKSLSDKLREYIKEVGNTLKPDDLKTLMDALNSMDKKVAEKSNFGDIGARFKDYKASLNGVEKANKDLELAQAGLLTNGFVLDKQTGDMVPKIISEEEARKKLTESEKASADAKEMLCLSADAVNAKIQGSIGIAESSLSILSDLGVEIPEELSGALEGLGATSQGVTDAIKGFTSGNIIAGIQGVVSAIGGMIKTIGSLFSGDGRKNRQIATMQDQVDNLEKSYERLEKAVEDAYSVAASNMINKQEANLRQQQKLIEQQLKLEKSKKNSDDGKIKEYEKSLEDTADKIKELEKKAIEAINGTSIQNAISDFASAYVDAWGAGDDKVKSTQDTVKKMVRAAVTELIKSRMSGEVEAFMNYLAMAMTDGILTPAEDRMLTDLNNKIIEGAGMIDKGFDKYLKDDNSARTATSNSGITASQDSVDKLSGCVTTIQSHTFNIVEQNKSLLLMNRAIMENVSIIRQQSMLLDHLSRLEGIENGIVSMKRDISSIHLQGLNIKR